MDKSLEESLYQAILVEDQDAVTHLLSQGANPNKNTSYGKTCLGEAAYTGKTDIVKVLIDTTKAHSPSKGFFRKRSMKSHKRKLRHDNQSNIVVKYKNPNERSQKKSNDGLNSDRNQGYYVFIHSEGSSSDESKISNMRSSLSPSSLTPSPEEDLEWDEEIGNVAPITSEDETWSSMYKWYAAILESTGAAIASASAVTNGIDQQDIFMKTALHYASLQGHTEVGKLLIDSGCKIDIVAGDGLTPLHTAAIRNHVEFVKILIAAGSNVNYKTHEKMTPLHFAASRGYLDVVNILVNNGAYLEARDTNERTALYLAAGRGHVDVIKYLISAGINVNGEEIHGYTPLCEAVWQRYSAVVEVLLSSGARITHSHKLLHNAIIQRQVEIVRMLAHLGGGINLHNDNGDTPLLLASRLSQPAVARILLENGANANLCNSITGASALHIAVESIDSPAEFEDILLSLLEYGIDMNSVALTGDTALNRALLLQKDYAAVLLIRHGADVNACDLHSFGLDNLSIASRRRSFSLASMLLKAGHRVPSPGFITKPPKPGSVSSALLAACKQPQNLSDLCRIEIRNWCKNKILFNFIESLPLPNSLKMFLMLKDEGIYLGSKKI